MSHDPLDQIAVAQYAWKTPVMQRLAARVCATALRNNTFCPDDFEHSDIADQDRNCIGSVFRVLRGLAIIEMTGAYRKSRAKGANGRVIFEYRAASAPLARALLKRIEPGLLPAERQGVLL